MAILAPSPKWVTFSLVLDCSLDALGGEETRAAPTPCGEERCGPRSLSTLLAAALQNKTGWFYFLSEWE